MLEQQLRPGALGEHDPVELDPDRARAGEDLEPAEDVAGMPDDEVVLLVPGVEAGEVEQHEPVEVGIGGREGDVLARLPGGAEGERLARGGVDGERHRGVQDRLPAGEPEAERSGGRAGVRGQQFAADVRARHGVGRQQALRLPDEERPAAVDDDLAGDGRTDAPAGGLVAQLRQQRLEHGGAHRGTGWECTDMVEPSCGEK